MRQPLGQHFLRNASIVDAIVRAGELAPQAVALEIGPGEGVLTAAFASKVKRLVAVELDRQLAAELDGRFPNVKIVHQDFLRADLEALFPVPERPIKVFGNLPYAVTSPILEKLLAWPGWTTGVFLVQREVAERMRSAPGSRVFGILSLAVQLFATVERILLVRPGAFRPPPKVMSAVIRVRRRSQAMLAPEWVPDFFSLAHAAFGHRRKTLANSLALSLQKPKEKTAQWLRDQGIDPMVRAETLALEDYVRLASPWAIFRRETV